LPAGRYSSDIKGCSCLVSSGAFFGSGPSEPYGPDGALGRVALGSTQRSTPWAALAWLIPPSRKISLLPGPPFLASLVRISAEQRLCIEMLAPVRKRPGGTLDCRSGEVGTVFPDPFDPVFDGGLRHLLLSAEGTPGTVAKSAYLRGIQH